MNAAHSQVQIDKGKAVVGISAYAMFMGGYERWIADLLKSVDRNKIDFLGVALGYYDGHCIELVDEVQRFTKLVNYGDVTRWSSYKNIITIVANCSPLVPLLPLLYNDGNVLYVGHGAGIPCHNALIPYVKYWAAVSPAAASALPNHSAVTIILNGVDINRCLPIIGRDEIRRRWKVSEDQIVLGYLGRIANDRSKKPELLAEVARMLGKRFVPVFVGEIYNKLTVEKIYAVCPSSKIVSSSIHVGDALAAMDCFVLPSLSEGCGLAIMEAWAAGVPTVSSDVGVVSYCRAKYGSPTVDVSACSADELARAVLKVMVDKESRRRAKDIILANYNIHEFGRRWTEYLCAIHTGEAPADKPFTPSETYVSIMTPVYNTKPEYLQEYWDSIKAQTWKHWELVIVDDGSTQTCTTEKLQEIAKDSRVRLVRLPVRCGVATARNVAINVAKYDLVANMDSDDVADQKWLARMVAAMKANPDIDICGCQLRLFDDTTGKTIYTTQHPEAITYECIKPRADTGGLWLINNPGVIFRRSKIVKIGGYNENSLYCEDLDLWLRAFKAGLKITNIPDILVNYRKHGKEQLTASPDMAYRSAILKREFSSCLKSLANVS